MGDVAIRAERLSKAYRIAQSGNRQRYRTLQEDLVRLPGRLTSWARPSGSSQGSRSGTFWALDDVSFEVEEGEVLGIIGRNGAGKSTLLKVLARITEPTRGEAQIYGRIGSLLEVGTGFHPELTGRENIYLSGAILGMRRDEITRRFDDIVEFSGVQQFTETPVKRYSSGMQMRLAFAVAAHLDTEILLVDEVLAVGDAEFQSKCLGKIGDVTREGKTVLFVSHSMNAVEQLCRSVLLLEAGRATRYGRDIHSTIQHYLFDSNESAASNAWVNSGSEFDNPWFRPNRILVTNASGQASPATVRHGSDSWLQVEGEVRKLHPALLVGYAIYSEGGNLLYWSLDTDGHPNEWPDIREGPCCLRSRLPVRLLNEGLYRIELIGGLHNLEWFFQPNANAPSLYLNIQGGLSESPHWVHPRPGLLAPVMKWEIKE